jgi:hypothetical protein
MTATSNDSAIGIYTRTVTRSPVVRWILSARIRSSAYDDVIFVGEDFVQVKQLSETHNLVDIAVKQDFDARIRAASVLDVDISSSDRDDGVKQESDAVLRPSQILVLTLDSNELLFLYVDHQDGNEPRFNHEARSLPAFARMVMQPGAHLAVDPRSRAIATAAYEREVILYSIKPRLVIMNALQAHLSWDPVSVEQPIAISGVIQAVEFLHPPNSDDEHIILMLLVVDEQKIKAIWLDWKALEGPHHAQLQPGHVLDLDHTLPCLLVPIADTAFLLASGESVTHWRNLVSGFAISEPLISTPEPPAFPGNSANLPLWTGWSRPRRASQFHLGYDGIYLLREDGLLFLVECTAAAPPRLIFIATLGLHHSSAIGSYVISHDHDIVVVGGGMSVGLVANVDRSILALQDISGEPSGMAIDITEHVHNWATVTDMVAAGQRRIDGPASRDAESILVTSGRHPYGSITELRKGLEARLLAYTEIDDLKTFTDIWALPDPSGSIMIVLSSPSATKFFAIAPDEGLEEIADTSTVDTDNRTLAIDFLAEGWMAQVSAQKLCLTNKSNATSWQRNVGDGPQSLVAATFERRSLALVTIERGGETHEVHCTWLRSLQTGKSDLTSTFPLSREPINVAASTVATGLLAGVSTADGGVTIIVFQDALNHPISHSIMIPFTGDQANICDSLTFFQRPVPDDAAPEILLLCGLRDGRMITYGIHLGSDQAIRHVETTYFGYSAVKILPLRNSQTSAVALCGRMMCLVRWDDRQTSLLAIENIWITDRDRPEFAQGHMVACAQAPSSIETGSHPFSDSLILLSDDSLLIAAPNNSVKTVPRQMQLIGTPFRLLYADSIRSYVIASVRSAADSRHRTRQVWPVLEFIARRGSSVSHYYDLQPGELIRTMVEWPYRIDGDKMYSHILVGGSYQRSNGGRRGRITFLKPNVRNWVVEGVKVAYKNMYDHEVTALAMYDAVTYIACAGTKVYLERFSDESRTWNRLCSAFQLASAGVFISVEPQREDGPIIVITTSMDSVIMLRLRCNESIPGQSQTFSLKCVGVAPQAESSLSHLVLPTALSTELGMDEIQLTLLSTKYGKIVGLACPVGSPFENGRVMFAAHLPQSITRMMRLQPSERRVSAPDGVVGDRMIGCSADGSVTGLAVLQAPLWSRLFWLQRLCEWSEDLCPHSYRNPRYSTSNADKGGQLDRPLPASFSDDLHLAMLRTRTSRPNDMHIDGDVIARILRPGGRDAIFRMIDKLADTPDAIGLWLSQHKEEELVSIEHLIRIVKQLEDWI